jgi:uncharacterized RDD family membrane protein YckC
MQEAPTHVNPAKRLAALVIDLAFLLVTMPLWMLPFAAFGSSLPEYSGAIVLVIAYVVYFGIAVGIGRSIGMRLMGIRVQRAEGAGAPGFLRGFVRAMLGGLPLAAIVLLVAAAFSDQPEGGYALADLVFLAAALVVFILGAAARVSILWDTRGRSLVDRASRVVVVQ